MQPSTSFNIPTLALIGPGLIGGSLAAALKSPGVVQQVLGVGRDANSLRQAQDLGLLHRPVSLPDAAAQADPVVLAPPARARAARPTVLYPPLQPPAPRTDPGTDRAEDG